MRCSVFQMRARLAAAVSESKIMTGGHWYLAIAEVLRGLPGLWHQLFSSLCPRMFRYEAGSCDYFAFHMAEMMSSPYCR